MNSRKFPYSFTVLRYIHDVATGEFLNVGIALYSPDARFVNAICRTRYTRIKDVFPSLDGDAFRAAVRHVSTRFESLNEELRNQLALSSRTNVMDFAQEVLNKDDSSLQWAPMGAGLTSDPAATLEQLYERLVTFYDGPATVTRKQDDDVWRAFSTALQKRQVLKFFAPKTIAVQGDQVEFDYAWKNGVWNCLAPVSFDLANAESIRDKAHRWLGQLASVGETSEVFRTLFLVGEPSQVELKDAFESALKILLKARDTEVFRESEAPELSERVARDVAKHP